MRVNTRRAAFAATLIGLVPAGCGGTASPEPDAQGRTVPTRFMVDLVQGDTARACRLLSKDAVAELRDNALSSFPAAVAEGRIKVQEPARVASDARSCPGVLRLVRVEAGQRALRRVLDEVRHAAPRADGTELINVGNEAWLAQRVDGTWLLIATNALVDALPS